MDNIFFIKLDIVCIPARVSATASRIHYERNRLYPNLEATIEILSSFVRLLYNWYLAACIHYIHSMHTTPS